MDESAVRTMMERVAGSEAPPARIDIGLARRQGRARLRWRRAAIAGGVPMIAAVAAVAAVIAGALPVGAGRQQIAPAGARGSVATPGSHAAPHPFSPLIPYARFGWLPHGRHMDYAFTSAQSDDLQVGPSGDPQSWDLKVYRAGGCNYTSGQVLGRLRSHQQTTLKCTLNWYSLGGRPTLANPVSAVAPPVNGHQAFWSTPVCNTSQCSVASALLMWSYAPGGWAWLSGPSRSDALKVADNITFGATAGPAIRFPVIFTGVSPSWRVGAVQSAPSGGVLAAQQWVLGTAATAPWIRASPQRPVKGDCSFLQPASAIRHQNIRGFSGVTTTTTAQGTQACADARGLQVYIFTSAPVVPDAIAILAHHLQVLGANPAAWTTQPVG